MYKRRNLQIRTAIINNDIHAVKNLLPTDDDDEYSPRNLVSALHTAASEGRCEIIDFFVGKGVNVEDTYVGLTPLQRAIHSGRIKGVEALLNLGANVHAFDANGCPTFHMAVQTGDKDIVELLVHNGADVNVLSHSLYLVHEAGVHLAARYGMLNVLNALISHSANLNIKDGNGNTAVHVAIECSEFDCATILVKAGADVFIRNQKCHNCLESIIKNGDIRLAEMFIAHGIDMYDEFEKAWSSCDGEKLNAPKMQGLKTVIYNNRFR